MNLSKFPRRGYLQGPTPIEPLKQLSAALGGRVNYWIKRDDLLPGCGGGNKTRKLDFCIAQGIAQGADTIITCGAVQSNHCRLTLAGRSKRDWIAIWYWRNASKAATKQMLQEIIFCFN